MSEIENLGQSAEKKHKEEDKEYYLQSLKDGYKGLLGAAIATSVSELILWFGQTNANPLWNPAFTEVNDNIPLIFAAIGFAVMFKHLIQIWQAKTQLKQLSLDE